MKETRQSLLAIILSITCTSVC